jgi:D-glycero-D-manno-heptose 1,7-bisphosphate phosphatase
MSRAAFLDRDGVINRALVREGKPKAPLTVEELEILEGVEESVDILKSQGYEIVVVSNQPDISRGLLQRSKLDEINAIVSRKTGIRHFRVCPHDNRDRCRCRKPLPGLIIDAATELNLDLPNSFLVGDRWSDIEAGNAAGCNCFYIDYDYDEPKPKNNFVRVSSLLHATTLLGGQSKYAG